MFAKKECRKTRNSLLTEKKSSNQLFSNFFCKSITFTKFLRKKCEREILQFLHCGEAIQCTVWKNEKFTLTEKNISPNQLFSNFHSKMLLSRNFCQKRVRVNFRNFHSAQCGKVKNLLSLKKYFVKSSL